MGRASYDSCSFETGYSQWGNIGHFDVEINRHGSPLAVAMPAVGTTRMRNMAESCNGSTVEGLWEKSLQRGGRGVGQQAGTNGLGSPGQRQGHRPGQIESHCPRCSLNPSR